MNFKFYACLTAGFLLTASTTAQESPFPVPDGWVLKRLTSAEVEPGPTASFLSTLPEIDGQLDPGLADLPAQNFTLLTKSNALNPEPRAVYRLGYSLRFLYLHVESDGQTLIQRDRGYQNGDGLILVLAHARPGEVPCDEFYVLGFSAARDSYRKVVWYYNKDLAFRRLSDNVLVQTFADGSKVGFELAIPWEELPGYHAFAPYPLGFNLCLVRAVGAEKEKSIFYVSPDPAVQSEQSPRRYRRLAFDLPRSSANRQTALLPGRGHLIYNEPLPMRIVTLPSGSEEDRVRVGVVTGEGEEILRTFYPVKAGVGLSQQEVHLDTAGLLPGGYRIRWQCQGTSERGEVGLTILPTLDFAQLGRRLGDVGKHLKRGTSTTLEFRLQELKASVERLKPYETCGRLRLEAESFLHFLGEAERRSDPLANRTGVFRRAFRSRLDDTLQPYSVRIPAGFNVSRRYPLLVYLHGSGDDDRGMLESLELPDNFLAMAPRARGTSHVYVQDLAQEDIQEAIDDMITNYPVDSDRIVLAGFSMGGYGALRAFYQTPSRFRSVAVFSGHPSLPAKWGVEGQHPDFLDPKYLKPFKGKNLFIAHGRKDQNLPFDVAERMVRALEAAGTTVQFVPDDTGHETSTQTRKLFLQWLEWVVRTAD